MIKLFRKLFKSKVEVISQQPITDIQKEKNIQRDKDILAIKKFEDRLTTLSLKRSYPSEFTAPNKSVPETSNFNSFSDYSSSSNFDLSLFPSFFSNI